ncbi:PTS fructose transporter subunit IIABC [Subdoligranulum variabile]|uniref:Phosphoenolpyruvate-dependent sugar phosphotransferase system, EIIA 2 n=1 Tax=Subdoligranulum variabile DSM 15176 TaxID=411471 RepID=D1PP97_9FIRM|nr:fructose-specific PTS transporter subunit EIIC [Subdoligranulum variabile]EFB75593.1 phosphoenolpyruvate-dependent sugar phosphotransferase system, EIIA 2 [Subdoligranulum variabile DSM 15176]UWP69036.1 fructose-specific PTS transporter subunit EIIC [Subdoligranulum variabile]
MHITDHLQPGSVALNRQADSLQAALQILVELMAAGGNLTDTQAFAADVQAREALGGTCVGGGLAIPHAKSAAVREPGLAALTLDPPLACDTPDGEPLRMMFLIAAPADANDLHVQVLAELATLMLDKDLCERLIGAESPQAFCDLIAEQEAADEPKAKHKKHTKPEAWRFVAVTACPTGLAHTYLAAEALQKAAQDRGVRLKVETDGAAGVSNPLTPDDIAGADCIIVAADRAVSTARFVGKRMVSVSAREAIRNPGAVLDRAAESNVPVYRGGDGFRANDWREQCREAYRHLMSGISHMLPFVVAGGVLIALALLFAQLGAPSPVTDMMDTVGRAAFVLIYPVLAAFIAYSISDMPAFMPGLMGGYLAQLGTTIGPEENWVSSGFWGALVAGFAAGLLIRLLNWIGRKLPSELEQVRTGLLTPVLSLLGVGALMVLIVNPPLGHFNLWLCDLLDTMQGGSRLALGALLGALMATDYGGPINKAAYLTGTLALVSNQYDIMAAVMVGGMVPPLAVGLSCLLFPNRFTPAERRTAPQNLLMGASFVTEGALSFALRDPLRVGPACIIGSGLAGFLSVLQNCGCPAPHGGIFLIAVIRNPPGFLLALAAGSLLGAVLLALLKKPLRG